MKYVILDCGPVQAAVVFPEAVKHSEAVNVEQRKPVSAGFCQVEHGRVKVSGESVSLGLRSREADAPIIEFSLAHMGLMGRQVEGSKSR